MNARPGSVEVAEQYWQVQASPARKTALLSPGTSLLMRAEPILMPEASLTYGFSLVRKR